MQISDLYQTKITCSTYNANIDSTDTVITVKLIDFNGAAVTNKSVTLTCDKGYFNKNGSTSISGTTTKSITATTNSSGEITATWTASEWGLCTFSANSTKSSVKIRGFKVLTDTSTVTLREYEEHVLLFVKGIDYIATTAFTDKDTMLTKDSLRPYMPVTVFSNTGNVLLRISDSTNKLQIRSAGSAQVRENVYAQMQWIKRSE